MEPDEPTRADVYDMHQRGLSTDQILSELGRRRGLDTSRILQDTGRSPLELIQVLTPNRGTPSAGVGEARRPERMRIDMESLRGLPPAEVAAYMADMLGIDIERVREDLRRTAPDRPVSDSDLIVAMADPESVARAEGFGPAAERFGRATARALPSVFAGTGAALLTAPSGPVGSGTAAIAAGAAAAPLGEAVEEAFFGPRVPLPPDEQMAGRFGEIAGTGVPFMFAPYAFSRGVGPERLSFLASRTGRELTPAQSIAVRNVTQPGQALTSEGISLAAGAGAGAAAEEALDGNPLGTTAAELAAGIFVPAERLTLLVDRGLGPLIRGLDAARTLDPSRLSRRVVLRDPETGDERLFDLSRGVDRSAASTLRAAGWEQLPQTDPTGMSSVMRLRSENGLARLVASLARDYGEDPVATAERLRAAGNDPRAIRQLAAEYGISPELIPETLPVPAMVDSPAIRAIYATIQSSPIELGPTRARARTQELVRGYEALEQMVRLLQSTGDPADFDDALRLQEQIFSDAIDTMLDANLAPAVAAGNRLLVDDPSARSRAGAAISEAVQESLGLARRQENLLWNRVDRSIPVELNNLSREAQSIMADLGITREAGEIDLSRIASPQLRTMLEVIQGATQTGDAAAALDADDPLAALEQALSREAAEFMGDAGDAAEAAVPTVGNALVLKRNLFDRILASRSAANPEFGNAQYYSRLYDALMEDLGVSAGAVAQGADGTLTEGQRALADANTFSRALNDTFTRAFAGQMLARDARGGRRMVPELLGRSLLTGGDDRISYTMRELDDAVTFALDNVNLTPEEAALAQNRVDTLRSNQETLLRLIASRAVDPNTGEVNVSRLQNLLRPDNPNGLAQALERFPALRNDLMNAETAQAALNAARRGASEAATAQGFLGEIFGMPPSEAVNAALREPGSRPDDAAARFRQLVRIANQNGGEFAEFARRGLFDTVMDQGITYAGGARGQISFDALRDYFFTPVGRAGGESSTVAGLLREQGFLTDAQLADFNTLLRQGRTIEQALSTSGTDAELRAALQEVSPITLSMVGRFLGASEGARISRAMGRGGTIQIPGYFANIGARLAERIPTTSMQDVFVRFLDDPEFAELTLRRAGNIGDLGGGNIATRAGRRAQRALRDFQAALVRNGLIVLSAGAAADMENDGITLPFVGAAEAATPDTAALEAFIQSAQPPAPAPATPAPSSPGPTTATRAVGAPPPAAPAVPPAAPRAGGSSSSYSALFPNDSISPMLQQRELQQGIGSLVGPR